MHIRSAAIAALAIVAMSGCQSADAPSDGAPETPAASLEAITADGLATTVQVLAHDSLEGRGPSSPGEEKTLRYLQSEFERLGFGPGVGDGFLQQVPLVSIEADPNMEMVIRGDGFADTLAFGSEFVAVTERVVETVRLEDSELVFVGYGAVAPEYTWNDYDGLEPAGKTLIVLVNDPGYATEDPDLFNGLAMTYYGRWTYKFEEAGRQGAARVLVVHDTGPAGYPWGVVERGWSGPQFALDATGDAQLADVEGWISTDVARAIFERAGLDFDALAESAAAPGFSPVPLGLTASVAIENQIERSVSNNIVAMLPGSEAPDEYVMYVAHWDHLGRDSSREGDQIYNGAYDNATGTAGLLEIAKAFGAAPEPPKRSILLMGVTAEEQGLLGSKYYAANPIHPLERTVAVINMDGLNIYGATHDITVVGFGNSELDDYVVAAAESQNRVVKPDAEPEKGFFYRSDQFSFAKKGVPSLYTDPGLDNVEHGAEWGMARREEYTAERYHQPSDEYDPNWDLGGAVQDLELYFMIGHRIANEDSYPNWREGNEFRARRDSMMASVATP